MKKNHVLDSSFFKVPTSLTFDQLKVYCGLWHPLQAEVTLGVVVLNGKIAQALLVQLRNSEDPKKASVLKEILTLQTQAAADEVGVGRIPGLIHYLLFEKQVMDSGISEWKSGDVFPEPLEELHFEIKKAFDGNLEEGLAMSVVIELIAPKLFIAQYEIFKRSGIDEDKLVHSKLHMNLEKMHANEACQTGEYILEIYEQEKINQLMIKYVGLWRNYLDFLAKAVYSQN
jgi:hypothetical protein